MFGEGWLKFCRLPSPVQHIRAGDVYKAEGFTISPRVLQDVVEVVDTVETEGSIGIAW